MMGRAKEKGKESNKEKRKDNKRNRTGMEERGKKTLTWERVRGEENLREGKRGGRGKMRRKKRERRKKCVLIYVIS